MTIEKFRQTEKLLYNYKFIKGYVELRKRDLQDLEYNGVKAIQYSDPAVKSNIISDPVAREYESIEKQRLFLQRVIMEKERIIERIECALGLLNDVENRIIEMKYFKGVRNNDIADNLGYSRKQIERIKKSAVQHIGVVLWLE